MSTAAGPDAVEDSLVLNLDAGNYRSYPGSGTTWFDLSGNDYHATLVGSPTYNSSGYISFNGTNQTASVVKPFPNIVGQISVELWVYFNNYSGGPVLMHKGNHYTLYMISTSGTDYWSWADSSNYSYANFGYRQATGLYATSTWMHLVCTKDTSNNVRIYRNGVLLDTRTTFGSALSATNSTLWVVGYSDTDSTPTANLLNGRVSVAKVFNMQLTTAQINQNFNANRSRFGV
jgi:hypothetical protein